MQTVSIKHLSYDELLALKKKVESAISKRFINSTNKVAKIFKVGDTVEISSSYGKPKGIIKEIWNNKLLVPDLDDPEYGNTPYHNAVSKIIRNGKVIYDRNKIK